MKELDLTEQRMPNRWGHSVCALSSGTGIVLEVSAKTEDVTMSFESS